MRPAVHFLPISYDNSSYAYPRLSIICFIFFFYFFFIRTICIILWKTAIELSYVIIQHVIHFRFRNSGALICRMTKLIDMLE